MSGKYHIQTRYKLNFNFPARVCSRECWFEFSFFRNPKDRFSCDGAHYVLSIFSGVVLIIGSLFGILASISLRNVRETDKEVTFVVDNTEPMLENKSDTDSYKHRPNDSVLRNDSEKKLEYCNGIEERNKLIQPMLDNKSHTDSYKLRPTDSVLRDNFERKLEYCNGIEEMNKLIQPTHFQCNGFGNYDSVH